MLDAGKEVTEERGSFHEGIPAITVIVDGGWSKRSPYKRGPHTMQTPVRQ